MQWNACIALCVEAVVWVRASLTPPPSCPTLALRSSSPTQPHSPLRRSCPSSSSTSGCGAWPLTAATTALWWRQRWRWPARWVGDCPAAAACRGAPVGCLQKEVACLPCMQIRLPLGPLALNLSVPAFLSASCLPCRWGALRLWGGWWRTSRTSRSPTGELS